MLPPRVLHRVQTIIPSQGSPFCCYCYANLVKAVRTNIIIPILQVKEQRHRSLKFAEGHLGSKSQCSGPVFFITSSGFFFVIPWGLPFQHGSLKSICWWFRWIRLCLLQCYKGKFSMDFIGVEQSNKCC